MINVAEVNQRHLLGEVDRSLKMLIKPIQFWVVESQYPKSLGQSNGNYLHLNDTLTVSQNFFLGQNCDKIGFQSPQNKIPRFNRLIQQIIVHGFIFVLFHLMPRGRTKHRNFCTSLLSLTWGPRVKRAPERLHWVLAVGSLNAIQNKDPKYSFHENTNKG